MASLIGQSIGRYHILEQLGEGGMATVYKAYDTRLERNVAVKVLRIDQFIPAQLQMVLQRFEREAKALARLTHPNIVHVLDFGEYEGAPYLVMEYLPGGTLKQKLGQAFPWQEAVKELIPVAQSLAYAHQHGIIHRDVKPANILINENGAPILTDFGIAKLLENPDGQTLTGSGVGLGTPEYMAPEQGMGARVVDGRADVYALGIVLYEMITGRKPYIADTPMAVVIKQINDPLPRAIDYVPDLPEDVEYVIIKALAKKPEDRFQSMDEFAKAMKSLSAESPKIEVPTSPVPTTPVEKKTVPRRRPSPKTIMAVIGVLAVFLVAVFGAPRMKQLLAFAPTVSMTSTPAFTSIPPSATLKPSSTLTLTRTPRPTATNTPVPTWVTNFAEPILATIKDRAPDYQDDFSIDTQRWYGGYGFQQFLLIDNGVMRLQHFSISNYDFLYMPNIVLQVDILVPISSNIAVTLASNSFENNPLKIQLDPDNQWSLRLKSEIASGIYKANGQKTQIIVIVKDSRAAFYVNGIPVAYYEYPKLLDDTKNERLFECGDTCYFDNVKFWNLDNIQNLP